MAKGSERLSPVLGLRAPSLGQRPGEKLNAIPANGLLFSGDEPWFGQETGWTFSV